MPSHVSIPRERMGVRLHWTDSDPKYLPSSDEAYYTINGVGNEEDPKGVYFKMLTPIDKFGNCLAWTPRRDRKWFRVIHGNRVVANAKVIPNETFEEHLAMGRSSPGWEIVFGKTSNEDGPEGFSMEITEREAYGLMPLLNERILIVRPADSWNGHGSYAERRDAEQPLLDKIAKLEEENRTLRAAFKILNQS